jgi:hypothetical protein
LEESGISVSDMFGNPLKYNSRVPQTQNGILVVHPNIRERALQKLSVCYDKLKM